MHILKTKLRWRMSSVFSLAVVIAVVGVFATVVGNTQVAHAATPVMTVEAESMSWNNWWNTAIVGDSYASNGSLVKNTNATGTITGTTGQFNEVRVAAKGDQCDGAPTMQVKLDGVVIGTQSVNTVNLVQYSFPVTASAGSHTLQVSFTNPYSVWYCSRALYVDKTDAFQSTPYVPTSPAPTGVPGTWTLAFSDEFNGNSLDHAKWANCVDYPNCGSSNGVYTRPSNATVGDGNLTLTLSDGFNGAEVTTNPHSGATSGYEFHTGVVEAKIYFPGNGTNCYNWPAWWTIGQAAWPTGGENDIAEVVAAGSDVGKMQVAYHWGAIAGAGNDTNRPSFPQSGYWCGGYHTYTLNRKATSSDVYYDGSLVASYATTDGNALQYLLLNVGSGGYTAYGTTSQVKVDYVRAWQ